MDLKDASPEIASVAQNYSGTKPPVWLVHMQEMLLSFSQWLQEWLNTLFRHRDVAAGHHESVSVFIQVLMYILGALALMAICYLLWKKAASSKSAKLATTRGAAAVEKILDSQGYRAEAESMASQGQYKDACRALYLCLLQQMHEKTVAVFAPAKTNFEYRYLLQSYPALNNGFMQMAEIVEFVWFGNKKAEQDDYNRCVQILSETGAEVSRIGEEKAAKLKAVEEAL